MKEKSPKYEFRIGERNNKTEKEGINSFFANGRFYYIHPPESFQDLGGIMLLKGLAMDLIEDGLKFEKEFYMGIFQNQDIAVTKVC
jgi:hypothetical protein